MANQRVAVKIEVDGVEEVLTGRMVSVLSDNIVLDLDAGGQMWINKDDLLEPVVILDEVKAPVKLRGEPMAKEVKEKVVKEKKEKVEGELKPLKEGSKLAQVVELCKANPNATRKELIALICEKVGMTPAGASTYHQNAKPYLA